MDGGMSRVRTEDLECASIQAHELNNGCNQLPYMLIF